MLIHQSYNSLSLVLLCGGYLFGTGDGACTWPSAVRDSQWYSSRGMITFTSTNMDGWAFQPQGTGGVTVSAWECLSSATFGTDGTLIMLTRTPFQLIQTNYYAYLCITLTQVTSASYQFYVKHTPHPNLSYERLYLSIVNSVTDPSKICNTTNSASGPEYNMLIRVGNETSAKVTCPHTFLGRYGYIHVSSGGTSTCNTSTSELNTCTNTQHMKFNYTACAARVTYSQSDTVWCVNNVFQNDINYVTVFNGNDADVIIDNVNFYRYTCMAVLSNASSASVSPQQCRSGQTPNAFPTTNAGNILGGRLTQLTSRSASCQMCPTLTNPSRGQVAITTSGSVTTATYTCQTNGTLRGNVTRVCQADNTWAGSEPFCSNTNCAVPPTPANGNVTVSSDGTVATFSCNVGYTLSGVRTRTCQNGLTWDGLNTTCVKCQTLTSLSGQTSSLSTNATVTSVKFTCANGYTLNGISLMTCITTGDWNDVQPTCTECKQLTNPLSGTVTLSTNGLVTKATYSCSSGYTLHGVANRYCLADGDWNGTNSMCFCNAPSNPSGGSVVSNGSVALYTCKIGSTINGLAIRTCQSNGSGWSGYIPTCRTCVTLTNVMGGSYTLSTAGTVTLATYTCNLGFTLTGVSQITCESSGNWNNTQPTCATCAILPPPTGGTVTMTTDGLNTKAAYTCLTGYTLNGVSPITCRSDGTWDFATPGCGQDSINEESNGAPLTNGTIAVSSVLAASVMANIFVFGLYLRRRRNHRSTSESHDTPETNASSPQSSNEYDLVSPSSDTSHHYEGLQMEAMGTSDGRHHLYVNDASVLPLPNTSNT